jgi:hypothetical protein
MPAARTKQPISDVHPSDAPIYVDTQTLAKRTDISVSSWEAWRANGEGPPYLRLPGNRRKVVYRWIDVVAWIEGGKIK